MSKHNQYMVNFTFSDERAAEFFRIFSPCLDFVENFKCVTAPKDEPEGAVVPKIWSNTEKKSTKGKGNPRTASEAKARFKRDQGPFARDIFVSEFGGKPEFLIHEAREALGKRGKAETTASPTLYNMVKAGQAEQLGTNRYRIIVKKKNGAGGVSYEGAGDLADEKTV